MTVELQDKLIERFPFVDCHIDTGDGWIDLLYDMCNELEDKIKNLKIDTIKAKFGTLRVYASTYPTPDINKIISKYEQESKHICRMCGYDFRNQEIKTGKCPECGCKR